MCHLHFAKQPTFILAVMLCAYICTDVQALRFDMITLSHMFYTTRLNILGIVCTVKTVCSRNL